MRTVKAEGEDRQADHARIALAMDDLRARQHQPRQSLDGLRNSGQLVDDARLGRRQRMQFGEINAMRLDRVLSASRDDDAMNRFRRIARIAAPINAINARGSAMRWPTL